VFSYINCIRKAIEKYISVTSPTFCRSLGLMGCSSGMYEQYKGSEGNIESVIFITNKIKWKIKY
jgi:hypothetical protein